MWPFQKKPKKIDNQSKELRESAKKQKEALERLDEANAKVMVALLKAKTRSAEDG